MNNIETLALSRSVPSPSATAARNNVESGEYQVDITARISGRITVGEDYTTVPTVSLGIKEVLAFAIHRFGCTREAAIAFVRDVYANAIANGNGHGSGALVAASEAVEAAMPQVDAMLQQLPRQPRKGVVRAYLEVVSLQTA